MMQSTRSKSMSVTSKYKLEQMRCCMKYVEKQNRWYHAFQIRDHFSNSLWWYWSKYDSTSSGLHFGADIHLRIW
jgi:hypothetical protein